VAIRSVQAGGNLYSPSEAEIDVILEGMAETRLAEVNFRRARKDQVKDSGLNRSKAHTV